MSPILYILLTFLILILVAAAVVIYRYHRQIQAGWLMWSAFRKMRKQVKHKKQKNIESKTTQSNSPLVRCSKCQKWTPQDGAVKLKSNFYCSHKCLEESFVAR